MLQRRIHRLHRHRGRHLLIPAYFRHKYRVPLLTGYLKDGGAAIRRQLVPCVLHILLPSVAADLIGHELLFVYLPAESLLS